MNDALAIDAGAEIEKIVATMREQVLGTLRKRGVVVGISGGIDSAVCASLAVRAFGANRVFGIFMPEHHSADESLELGQLLAGELGIATAIEDVGPGLEALGCYRRQIEAIRAVVPEYSAGWKCKLVLPSILATDRLNVFQLTVQSPDGAKQTVRLPLDAYLALVAATNMKQRTRKLIEYTHADRLNYAVIGTPNRLEYDQGFFVKQGDGAADVKPIAHLYKTQVYALAKVLGVPAAIQARPPTTDTWSLEQTQEEFFFALPYAKLDLCLWALDHGIAASEVAPRVGLEPAQVERVFRDIEAKRRATRYLHTAPLLVAPVAGVDAHAPRESGPRMMTPGAAEG
jgi:NAD+ synthase